MKYLSVIKVEKDRVIIDFFGAKLICGLYNFKGPVMENDIVFLKDGLFHTDKEETDRVKKENYRRIHRIKDKQ